MPKHKVRVARMEKVEEEYKAAQSAAELLERKLQVEPSFGRDFGLRRQGGRDFRTNLESTYIVRLYAEFEAGLRDYWRNHEKQDTKPGMSQLVKESLASRRTIPNDIVEDTIRVVRYRNSLVHEIDDQIGPDVVPCSFAEAKKIIRTYFSRLNRVW